MKTRKFKIVEISWVDAEAREPGWNEDDPDKRPTVLKTYGLLVRRDNNFVVHASTYDPDTHRYSELAKIPRGMVKSVRKIGETEIELPEEAT